MKTLLVEIGCEELPATVCRSLYRQLAGDGDAGGLVYRLLRDERLLALGEHEHAAAAADEAAFAARLQVLISPRRVAVLVRDVPERQSAQTQVFRGPRADVAFGPDGAPAKAGLGFARSRGVAPEQLGRQVVDGTEFVTAQVEAPRLSAREVVPGIVAALIAGLQIPRGMRWGAKPAGEAEHLRFSRPIRWLVCKLGSETIEFNFYGLRAGDVTQGHRVLGAPIILDTADHYARHLREQKVVADQSERRAEIERQLNAQAAALGGSWFDPGDVLDEAVYLVEWPVVHHGSFDERHLRLPGEVLITAMQSHQRYFPVRDAGGALLPVFLYVSNADPAAAAIVTHGNERVLDGRLDDAEFAYDRDLREGLPALAGKLPSITFHEKLGSLADKAARLERLATWLVAGVPDGELPATVATAARFAKADLPSQVVQEFPTLQGQMGGQYAEAAGLGAGAAQAIAEHYRPLSAAAPVPASLAGALVAIADKADNMAGAWVAGEKPSGSRDPYGLRRAALGIVRCALEYALRVGVRPLIGEAVRGYTEQGRSMPVAAADKPAPESEMENFIWERLQGLLIDEGLPFALVEAALGSAAADIPARAARARSFAALESRAAFADVVAAYNRCASLAAKSAGAGGAVRPQLFAEPVEGELNQALAAVGADVASELDHLEIASAVMAGARLRPVIDRYFDDVLVMSPDEDVRANRLAQLAAVVDVLRTIGDFGRLPVQQTE
jgi:glycyl-tRNA synthetase beta chain